MSLNPEVVLTYTSKGKELFVKGIDDADKTAEKLSKSIGRLENSNRLLDEQMQNPEYRAALQKKIQLQEKNKISLEKMRAEAKRAAMAEAGLATETKATATEMKKADPAIKQVGTSMVLVADAALNVAGKVANATTNLVDFAAEGARANDIARNFKGNIDALRTASANLADDTALQRYAIQADAVGLSAAQFEAYVNRISVAVLQSGVETNRTAEFIEKGLKGEAEALREINIIVDTSAKAYAGLSETAKKAMVAQQLANQSYSTGIRATDLALDSQAAQVQQAQTQWDNLVSSLQQAIAEELTQGSTLEDVKTVMEAAAGAAKLLAAGVRGLADAYVWANDAAYDFVDSLGDANSSLGDFSIGAASVLGGPIYGLGTYLGVDFLQSVEGATNSFGGFTRAFKDATNLELALSRQLGKELDEKIAKQKESFSLALASSIQIANSMTAQANSIKAAEKLLEIQASMLEKQQQEADKAAAAKAAEAKARQANLDALWAETEAYAANYDRLASLGGEEFARSQGFTAELAGLDPETFEVEKQRLEDEKALQEFRMEALVLHADAFREGLDFRLEAIEEEKAAAIAAEDALQKKRQQAAKAQEKMSKDMAAIRAKELQDRYALGTAIAQGTQQVLESAGVTGVATSVIGALVSSAEAAYQFARGNLAGGASALASVASFVAAEAVSRSYAGGGGGAGSSAASSAASSSAAAASATPYSANNLSSGSPEYRTETFLGIQVDGRDFGEVSIDGANRSTRFGNTRLNARAVSTRRGRVFN